MPPPLHGARPPDSSPTRREDRPRNGRLEALSELSGAFSWEVATAQFLAGLAPIPAALRATLAVSRSSAMIARMTARLTARRLTE
jgi:hypothetical protein